MATRIDGKTSDGICYTVLRDGDGKPRKDVKGRQVRSYTFRYRDAAGRSRQFSSGNLAEVRVRRDEVREALNRGNYVDPSKGKITVGDHAEAWLAAQKPILDFSTWRAHASRVRNHIMPQLGHLRLNQLDAATIEEFQGYLCQGRSLSTARMYFTTLNQIIGDAVDKGILSADPRKGVTKIKTEWLKKKIPFEPDEVAAIGLAAPDLDLDRLVTSIRGTGLRISELLGLDETQLDLTEGAEALHVDRQLGQDDHKQTILKDPKSAKGNRVIPLPTWALEAIKAQMKAAPPQPHTLTWVHRDKNRHTITAHLIFHDGHGNPLNYSDIRRQWNAAVKAAGIHANGEEGAGLHRLRHTYAADLIRLGVDLYVVSRLMGHSSVRVTEQYYAHLRRETLDTARSALNQLTPGRPNLTIVHSA